MTPAVFFDRDGTIIRRPGVDTQTQWCDGLLLDGAVDWIRIFNALRYTIVVVSNQAAVAQGNVTEDQVLRFNQQMLKAFRERGAMIDDVLICPHVEADQCDCRKPKTGLALTAQAKWGIDFGRSLVVGDSDSDKEMARRLGITFISVLGGVIQSIEHP
jgi:histidinol-phosphate phosphatase family protein